jgi:hypothetical protein
MRTGIPPEKRRIEETRDPIGYRKALGIAEEAKHLSLKEI